MSSSLPQLLSDTLATSLTYLPSTLPYISRTLAQAQNGTTSEAVKHYLAAGTDFTSLSVFEQWWAAWYLLIGTHTIATGLMSFIMHEVNNLSFFCAPLIVSSYRSFISDDVYHG